MQASFSVNRKSTCFNNSLRSIHAYLGLNQRYNRTPDTRSTCVWTEAQYCDFSSHFTLVQIPAYRYYISCYDYNQSTYMVGFCLIICRQVSTIQLEL